MGLFFLVQQKSKSLNGGFRVLTFQADVKAIAMGAYDLVLGMDWFDRPMTCDWLEKWIEFEHQGKWVRLQGIVHN
jgi:hypothetical protein